MGHGGGALFVSMATIAASLPYVKASGEFKEHYYAAAISPHTMTQPYRQMLSDYTRYPHAVQTVLAGLLVVAAVLGGVGLHSSGTAGAGGADDGPRGRCCFCW